ncbi:hypothetical protein QE152_g34784 [Popillia japonica]|uniref:Uncharacterized protein n=1 Tax=Popillia japonica TaxID=7064 RepID=A0AAW1IST1_POPJA
MSFIDKFIQQRRRYILNTSFAYINDEKNSHLSSYNEESQVNTEDAYRQAESEVFDRCEVEMLDLCGPSTSSSEDIAREASQVQQVCTPPSKRQKTVHLQKK